MADAAGARRRVLLLGEGDFTFALSLALALPPTVELTATGFDALPALREKYRDAPATLARLAATRTTVLHGVDATALGAFADGGFDECVLTHPHLGVESATAHHRLLCHYFAAARGAAPVARVTLAGDQAARWRCDAAAARSGLERRASAPFIDAAFARYVRRRPAQVSKAIDETRPKIFNWMLIPE